MRKWIYRSLILVVSVLALIAIPVVRFATSSGTFTPPAPDSAEAQIPALPYAHAVPAPPQDAEPENPLEESKPEADSLPASDTALATDILDDPVVAKLVAAFQERQPDAPRPPARYYREERVPNALTDIAYAVLQDAAPEERLLKLVHHPDPAVRKAAIEALLVAQNAMASEGAMALLQFLAHTGEEDLNQLVFAATETLIADTQAGRLGNAQVLLIFLGDYAQPAVPHLLWAFQNHPEAEMRAWTLSAAVMLDPQSDRAREAVQQGLHDPDGAVRVQALLHLLLRPIATRRSSIGMERRPGDVPGDNVAPEVPKEKSALSVT